MTTLDLTGYPGPESNPTLALSTRVQMLHSLSSFLGRSGLWRTTPPGQVVSLLWTELGGGHTDPYPAWAPAEDTVDIDLSHLTRKELSSLARMLDVFAREHPNTSQIKAFVEAIVADDAAAQTDPHAPRLFDM